MHKNLSADEKLEIIQNEIYNIAAITSVLSEALLYNEDGRGQYENYISVLEMQKEHIESVLKMY